MQHLSRHDRTSMECENLPVISSTHAFAYFRMRKPLAQLAWRTSILWSSHELIPKNHILWNLNQYMIRMFRMMLVLHRCFCDPTQNPIGITPWLAHYLSSKLVMPCARCRECWSLAVLSKRPIPDFSICRASMHCCCNAPLAC